MAEGKDGRRRHERLCLVRKPCAEWGPLSGTGLFGSDVPGADFDAAPPADELRARGMVAYRSRVAAGWKRCYCRDKLESYPKPGGPTSPIGEAELHGIEADTGRELWQIPLSKSRSEDRSRPIGIYGSVIALVPDDQIYNAKTQRMERREGGNQANFLNGVPGSRYSPPRRKGKPL